MRRIFFLSLAFGCMFFAADARQQRTTSNDSVVAIVGAVIIDGAGSEPKTGTVIIRGDKIDAVGADLQIPANALVIQAAGHTVLPGLFDLHTHLQYATGSGISGDWAKNLKAYLYCGVTSVVDFGTYPETFEPMRRLIKSGVVDSPRISLAARMTTPGGHGMEGGRGDFFSLQVANARDARTAVQKVLPYRPDVIKVFTDGWRYGGEPDLTSMNFETLSALVDEAHKHGIEVLTHTVSLEKAKIATRAKVDVIAHGIGDAEIDEEIVQLMKSGGTVYAPTLAVYEPRSRAILTPLLAATLDSTVREKIEPPLTPPPTPDGRLPILTSAEIQRANSVQMHRFRRWVILQNNTAALRKGGAVFGVGTDAGVVGTHHGWATLRELELLVSSGLSPLEAITAATGNAARALKVDSERGVIAAGKLADLLIVEGRPHVNILDLERTKHVFLNGREIDREKLRLSIASPALTGIPAIKASELVDDFGKNDGRSALDTLWVNSTDSGNAPSQSLFGVITREPGNRALSITARMAIKDNPFVRLNVPLSRGAVEPVDARQFRGVKFDVRGDGEYKLFIPIYAVRDSDHFQAPFKATTQWRTVSIDFSSLKRARNRTPAKWTGEDLLMLSFEIARPGGEFGWLELDNIRFYK